MEKIIIKDKGQAKKIIKQLEVYENKLKEEERKELKSKRKTTPQASKLDIDIRDLGKDRERAEKFQEKRRKERTYDKKVRDQKAATLKEAKESLVSHLSLEAK